MGLVEEDMVIVRRSIDLNILRDVVWLLKKSKRKTSEFFEEGEIGLSLFPDRIPVRFNAEDTRRLPTWLEEWMIS